MAIVVINSVRKRQFQQLILFLLLSTLTALGIGCNRTSSKTIIVPKVSEAATVESQEAQKILQNQLSQSTDEFIGQTVSLRGEVKTIIEKTSFLLEDERVFGGKDVLIINGGEPVVLLDGDESDLEVVGIVHQLILADLEKDYGIKLDHDLYAEYENRPAIVAQSIVLAPGPGELTQNPEKYYGQRIALAGEVDQILAPMAFTLDEEQFFGGEDLLVISPATPIQAAVEEEVVVTGILRPYHEEVFAQDYTLNWDNSVQQKIDAEYTEKPVFVADDLYSPAAPIRP